MIRFAGQATVFQVTLPYAQVQPYPEIAKNNFIDEKMIAKWKDLGLTPSGPCTDEEFFRRIHLDTIGTRARARKSALSRRVGSSALSSRLIVARASLQAVRPKAMKEFSTGERKTAPPASIRTT